MQPIKITAQELKTINYTDKQTGEAKSFDKYVISSDKTKYEFSTHKKDGSLTMAYEYIKQFKPAIGDIVNAEVEVEDAPFKGKDGKIVAFKRYRIMYFETVEGLPTIAIDETPTEIKENIHDCKEDEKNREDCGICGTPTETAKQEEPITATEMAKGGIEEVPKEPTVEELNDMMEKC